MRACLLVRGSPSQYPVSPGFVALVEVENSSFSQRLDAQIRPDEYLYERQEVAEMEGLVVGAGVKVAWSCLKHC